MTKEIRTDNSETLKNALDRIAKLEKENAELKARNKWYSEQICYKECAEVWGSLTKAKEIIKDFLLWENNWHEKTEIKYALLKRAEDFIKELDK